MRGLSGWQTALADLALILFVVVAVAHREDAGEAEEASDVALGQPMAVFRAGGDADLAQWIAAQDLSHGQIATVIVGHAPGGAAPAIAEAAGLVARIERTGEEARLLVEPASVPETLVVIAHDRSADNGTGIAGTR